MNWPDDYINKIICGDCLDNHQRLSIMRLCQKDNSKTLSQEQRKYPRVPKRANGLYVQFAPHNFGENLLILKTAILNSVQKNVILNGKNLARKYSIIPSIKEVIKILTGRAALTLSIKEYVQDWSMRIGDYLSLNGINIPVKIAVLVEFIFMLTIKNLSQRILNYDLI